MLMLLASFFTKSYHYLLILTLLLSPETSTVVYKRSWQVKLSKIYNILGLLDVNKVVGPDSVSPHILQSVGGV